MSRIGVFTPTHRVSLKIPYLREGLRNLQAQTVQDWDWYILVDRRADLEAAQELELPANAVVCLAEPKNRGQSHPLPWLLNQFYASSDNEFLFLYADDDLLNPRVFEVFTRFFDENPALEACYVSLQHQFATAADEPNPGAHWLYADGIRGPGSLDCRIDGGQVCVRKSLLSRVEYPWWPETPDWGELRHMDGRYLENVARAASFIPVGDRETPYVVHRFTPVSTFTPHFG